jgi:hypothetical protein
VTQYINLLPRQRAAPRDALSLRNVVLVSVVVMTACVAASTVLKLRNADLKRQEASLRTSIDALSAPGRSAQVALDAELARRLAEARARAELARDTAQYMRGLESHRADAFSAYFDALSRQTLAGVWLTGLFADFAADRVTIDARALSPDLVPSYLRRLNGEELFRSRRFASLSVKEREVRPGDSEAARDGEAPALRIVEFKLESPIQPPGAGGGQTRSSR